MQVLRHTAWLAVLHNLLSQQRGCSLLQLAIHTALWWGAVAFSKASSLHRVTAIKQTPSTTSCPWKQALPAQPLGEGGSQKPSDRLWAEAPPGPTLLTVEMVLRQVLLQSSRCNSKLRKLNRKPRVTCGCHVHWAFSIASPSGVPVIILFRCTETMQISWITIFFTLINYHLYQWSIVVLLHPSLQPKNDCWFQQIHL